MSDLSYIYPETQKVMSNIRVDDETAVLKDVILGSAKSLGGTPTVEQAYDARSKESIRMGIYPLEEDLDRQMAEFEKVLKKYSVNVRKPELLENCNQVYTRDIGFVIGDKFISPNIIADREHEKEGIANFLLELREDEILIMPEGARAEGGDVIVCGNEIYVGYSEQEDFDEFYVSRTNTKGLDFLKRTFASEYKVYGFELNKSDDNPRKSALHLDCCFQPVGENLCIIARDGFKKQEDYDFLIMKFGKGNSIEISNEEMYDMNSNVFSLAPNVVVSELGFKRINQELAHRGLKIETVDYQEVRKMGGLFRCSTLPLRRENGGK